MSPDTAQRLVLITGATRGVGRGIAQAFLRAGAVIETCGRTEPAELPDGGEGVLLLEELNRAELPVMQPALQLLSARRLHTWELPPGWICAAAINPEGEDYDVRRLDPALRSRFRPPVVLWGTGTVFRRDVLERFPWTAASNPADRDYVRTLVRAGIKVRLVEDVCVRGKPADAPAPARAAAA